MPGISISRSLQYEESHGGTVHHEWGRDGTASPARITYVSLAAAIDELFL